MKTIEIPEETYNALIELSTELNTQNHRATAMPYFFQVFEQIEVPTGEGMGEEVWVCDGEICLRKAEDIKEAVFEYKGWVSTCDEDNKLFEELYDFEIEVILENNYRKCYVTTGEKYSNAFLTEKACKQHIKNNGYHYQKPSDYLTHAFRNPELEMVMNFICSLTGGKAHK